MAKSRNLDESVFLDDMLESINKIEENVAGLNEFDFEKNTEKQDAVFRRIEILGEAVKNISIKTKEKYFDVPWKEMLA